jgi:Cytochrome C'
MSRTLFAVAIATPLLLVAPASPQVLPRNRLPGPKPEPIAETKLLMEGLLQANVRGLEKNLRQAPTDQETWTFVRGQALLIAETGNLLMLRPPRAEGQEAWMASAADLREKATTLAKLAATRDADRARRALTNLAGTCNQCHQTFRVNVQVAPFQAPKN